MLVVFATALLAAPIAGGGLLQAATFTIDTLGDMTHDANPGDGVAEDENGDTTLRVAVEEANALTGPDTINFSNSLVGNGNYVLVCATDWSVTDSELVIADDLTINGLGWNLAIDQAQNANFTRVFEVDAGVTVVINSLVVINNAGGGNGAVILNHGNLTVNNSEFDGNNAVGNGGAIYNDFGSLTIDSCMFGNNFSGADGGAILNIGACEITSSVFSVNSAPNNGGAVAVWSDPTSIVDIHNCEFEQNSATGFGGAAYNDGQLAIDEGSTLEDNYAVGGGAIFNDRHGSLTLDSTAIQLNSIGGGDPAPNDGGGIMTSGSLDVHANCVISDNDPNDIVYGT
jgi:predicted outer membrane repeat protein